MSESLTEFIKKYGKPYDPKVDDYDTGPFQKSIDDAQKSTGKIYGMHMYWVKQVPQVVKQHIEHYTKPGDIVLDAFCGTGMTGVAAMLCGRHAILTEISPACIHIARNYTTPIEPHTLERAYYRLREKVEPEIGPLYKTMCHNCKNPDAHIANTILSDVLRCPRCSAEVLYAGSGRWAKMKRGEKFRKILCQNCGYEFTKAKVQFVRVEPIEIRVDCPRCKTKGEKKGKPLDKEDWRRYIDIEGGERFINKLGNEILEEIKEEERLEKIPPKEPPYWYPRDVKFFGDEPRRNYKRDITHPYQMFSRRNLIALSILWHYVNEIEEEKVRDKMRFTFTGMLFYVSLMRRWVYSNVAGVPLKGTLFIASVIQDVNTIEIFDFKIKQVLRGLRELLPFKGNGSVFLKKLSATNLNFGDNTIDYAFYDPPYGANINYSELNIVWEAWLNEFTMVKDEIIENKYQGKNRDIYGKMMLAALKEVYRVLKPGRWLTMIYSYSDPSMYRIIQNIAHEAGFVDEGVLLHINSASKTFAQETSDKSQQRFLVINFKKPKDAKKKAIKKSEDIDYDVIRVIQDFLTKQPGKTRDYIYDQVIKQLFSTVQIQKFDLDEILKNFFRKVGDEWYAPGTLLTRKENEDKQQRELFGKSTSEHPEKEVILQLQEFLKKYRQVPYSELREFYLRKIDISLERDFDDIIKENFKVEEGKVRLPTPVEQERMQDISVQYQIRVIRRFLDGKLDYMPQTEELSDWVEFCYQNELYKEGSQIFNLLGEDKVEPGRYKKLKKIAEVCRIKSE
ncbi:MAG: DNA methyltransferase [Candidatus Aerophobetes bacterium]|nr:DNA methyltransferase [Candidatus Aerophobetes bacterium]